MCGECLLVFFLQIVQEINDAIENIVDKYLKPIKNKIMDWLQGSVNLPDFPPIEADILPLGQFDAISVDMPQAPDTNAISDLPSKALGRVMNELPTPLNTLRDCATDLDCVTEKLGLGNLTNFFSYFPDVIGNLGDVLDKFQEVLV